MSEALTFRLDVEAFADPTHWRNRALRGKPKKDGEPGPLLANLFNATLALANDPSWREVLRWNDFTMQVETGAATPWEYRGKWDDVQDFRTAGWLQEQGINCNPQTAGQAVQTAARENPFHPLREWLLSLQWDGARRLDAWLTYYCGAVSTEFTAAAGRLWLISAVARVLQPGCKADACLILEGDQGIGKSRGLRALAGEYFTDDLADLGSKDASMQIMGAWVVELSELDALVRAEPSRTKAFISRSTDRFRPPYGQHVIEAPRQCVFAGTVNHRTYLNDESGGRRFWPIRCGATVDVAGLERDREQIWAEAVHAYGHGARWWIESDEVRQEAIEEQADRFNDDPWHQTIERFVNGRDWVTTDEIFKDCLEIADKAHWTQAAKNRIGRCLRTLGFEMSRRRFPDGRNIRGYERRDNS